MGQYFLVVNTKQRAYLHPHKFDEGLKFLEFTSGRYGTVFALAALVSNGNGRGGGDLRSKHPLIGSWAGDPIVIAGDYGDPGAFIPPEHLKEFYEKTGEEDFPTLYHLAHELYTDISEEAIKAICGDSEIKTHFEGKQNRLR